MKFSLSFFHQGWPATVLLLSIVMIIQSSFRPRFTSTVIAYQVKRTRSDRRVSSSSSASFSDGLPKQTIISSSTAEVMTSKSKRKYRNDNEYLEDERTSSQNIGAINYLLQGTLTGGSFTAAKKKISIHTVDELRSAVLDQGMKLSDTMIVDKQGNTTLSIIEQSFNILNSKAATTATSGVSTDFFNDHAVRTLMLERFESESTPGHRHEKDNATLALSIEGGGMRGCVSAGMVAAIAALGLTDTIDKVYGSSAGSVVGSYLVSRQVCMDVYVDILPAAKKLFVCKKRMFKSLASSLADVLISSMRGDQDNLPDQSRHSPGMNISFVLDSIMGQDHGIRPLDLTTFQQNNLKQPLRVVSSCIDPNTGRLFSRCFGTEDFFNETAVKKADGSREGLFACLEASMTVPGATGPPVNILQDNGQVLPCFDAFCFEPVPYRSAVEEGATHVLVLSSRPEEYKPKTKPGIYETGVAPLYFHSHGRKEVGDFFERGGQQYLYAEDLLTFEQAKTKKILSADDEQDQRIQIPPAEILYGVPETAQMRECIEKRDKNWKRAHLMPLRVPKGHKELPTLEQSKDAVLEAVRGGFATAFDSLSSIVGLDHICGTEAAKLVFPDDDMTSAEEILGSKMHVPGEIIPQPSAKSANPSFWPTPGKENIKGFGLFSRPFRAKTLDQTSLRCVGGAEVDDKICHQTLLATLPGFQEGRLGHLARGLRNGGNI